MLSADLASSPFHVWESVQLHRKHHSNLLQPTLASGGQKK